MLFHLVQVTKAKDLLNKLDHADVVTVATVQAGQSLLHRQSKLIEEMIQEGFLDSKSAEHFFSVIDHDSCRMYELRDKREAIKIVRRRTDRALLNLAQKRCIHSSQLCNMFF